MSDNVLLEALPPAVDYLAYLTILEYNLTSDQLPVLHNILQDTTLTTNIGWDLVHLLLPLLPASKECLQDVARLGNPREVVLKTTEQLEGLGLEGDTEDDESEAEAQDVDTLDGDDIGESETNKHGAGDTADTGQDSGDAYTPSEHEDEAGEERTSATALGRSGPGSIGGDPPAVESSASRSISKFVTLVDMLGVLHPRIKTKYPSRFLATTLQAILRAYSRLAQVREATTAVLKFLRVMSGMYRPVLPLRQSTASLSRLPAPDPEDRKEEVSTEEVALQTRLLQSFLTHVLEDYINNLRAVDDVPGMAWASRLSETKRFERAIPGKVLYRTRFEEDPELVSRTTTINQINGIARHLKIDHEELLSIVLALESDSPPTSPSSDLPSQASDVPLSPTGSLYLFTASTFATAVADLNAPMPTISIFPSHALILSKYLNPSATSPPTEGLLDSILFLGLCAVHNASVSHAKDDEQFSTYLYTLSLVSATCPSPPLRYHAHITTSHVLHSHPSPSARLSFIQATLEHSPHSNLKPSAIAWLKTEILSSSATQPPQLPAASSAPQKEADPSIFATPACLETLAPHLFFPPPNPTGPPDLPFYLSLLNLHYLLCASAPLRSRYRIPAFNAERDVVGNFIAPLRGAGARIREEELKGGKGGAEGEEVEEGLARLALLDHMLDRVEEAMAGVGLDLDLDLDLGVRGMDGGE